MTTLLQIEDVKDDIYNIKKVIFSIDVVWSMQKNNFWTCQFPKEDLLSVRIIGLNYSPCYEEHHKQEEKRREEKKRSIISKKRREEEEHRKQGEERREEEEHHKQGEERREELCSQDCEKVYKIVKKYDEQKAPKPACDPLLLGS